MFLGGHQLKGIDTVYFLTGRSSEDAPGKPRLSVGGLAVSDPGEVQREHSGCE